MEQVTPEVHLIARPEIDWEGMTDYLKDAGVDTTLSRKAAEDGWFSNRFWDDETPDGEFLVEFGGRMCYRSWAPGLNPNVTKVREDRGEYLRNILLSGHGSVLEHANYTFAFRHISRVVTHELVRHRAGTAISQESMRFVRLDDVPMWLPDWAREDEALMNYLTSEVMRAEAFQVWMAEHFKLDDPKTPFSEKKAKTSFMRRFAPGGVATEMTWTANIRALRHIIESRTSIHAEEEIRLVFGKVAQIMIEEAPLLFGDFQDVGGSWIPEWRKV
jgi:thymidylate synthase (FAD)